MEDREHICGTCKHCRGYKLDWMCYNKDSEYYCCFCDYDDGCDDWEDRHEN